MNRTPISSATSSNQGDSPGALLTDAFSSDLSVQLTDSDSRQLRPGDQVELVPAHNDTTVHLHDHLFAMRAGELEMVWVVAGRGRIR